MDRATPLADVTNQTTTRKRGQSNTDRIGNICIYYVSVYVANYVIGCTCTYYFLFDTVEENIDPTEQARQKRRQKYASLPEEKERRPSLARENYKRQKGRTQNLDLGFV